MPEIVIVSVIVCLVLAAAIIGSIIFRRKRSIEKEQTNKDIDKLFKNIDKIFENKNQRFINEIEQINKNIDELFNNKDLCSIIEKQAPNTAIRYILLEMLLLPMDKANILNISNSQKFNALFTNVSNPNNNYLYLIKSLNKATIEYLNADLEFSLQIKEQIGEVYKLVNVKNIGMFTAQFALEDCKEFLKLFELYDFLQTQNVITNTGEKTYFFAFLYIVYYFKIVKLCEYVNKNIKNLSIDSNISLEEFIQRLYDLHTLDIDTIRSYCLFALYYQNNYKLAFSRIVSENKDKINKLLQKCVDKEKLEKLRNGNYNTRRYSMLEIDSMNGQEFEDFVVELFNNLGYQAERTKLSGDQGVDVIAKKGNQILAIQAKHYNQAVGNHAIMEVVGGAKFYNATLCYVVTNNYFTKSARQLAAANNVMLWDREKLIEKLSEI